MTEVAEQILNSPNGRRLSYLRLSVTDRCNLRCRYCMPPEGVPKLDHGDILTYEECLRLLSVGARLGLEKLRLTGGEPLLRRGLADFIAAVSGRGLFKSIRLTTNAVLLEREAEALRRAGLNAVNISLDALTPRVYAALVGRSGAEGEKLFAAAWRGFEAALAAGFESVKINCVPILGVNDGEALPLARLTLEYPVEVRFIEFMPIGPDKDLSYERRWPGRDLKAFLEKDLGPFAPLPGSELSGPARLYRAAGAPGAVGFISAMSDNFCFACNRLRLTADGRLKPCLMTKDEIDLRGPLRQGASDAELFALFQSAAAHKPVSHAEPGVNSSLSRQMSRTGG